MHKKITHKSNPIIIIIVIVVIFIIWILINSRNSYEPQTYNLKTSLDIAIGGSVENSVEYASFIVYGQYTELIKEVSTGGGNYSEIYSFKIEESLLGDASGEIPVVVSSFMTMNETVDDHYYTARVGLPNNIEPVLGNNYLIFLTYVKDYDVYSGSAAPSNIEFDEKGIASLRYNENTSASDKNTKGDQVIFTLDGADFEYYDKISGLTKDDLMNKVKDAIAKKNMEN